MLSVSTHMVIVITLTLILFFTGFIHPASSGTKGTKT